MSRAILTVFMSLEHLLFLDTETTGNDLTKDRLVEVCYKKHSDADIVCELFNPPLPISVDSMAVTHITNKMVQDKPAFQGSPMEKDLTSLLKNHILVAHNAPFDIAMLKAEGLSVPQFIDTLRVARELDAEGKIPKYNLQYLRYYLGIEIPEAKAHDAKSDVLVLEALFERLYEKVLKDTQTQEQALEKMLEISSHPSIIRTFSFGKHIGRKVEEVLETDRDYLEWLLKQKEQDPSVTEEDDWIYTLKHYLHNK